MNVLAVLEGAVHAGDHGDVVLVLNQRTHGGGELERIDSRLVQDPLLVLELVGVEPADETRQHRLFFTGKEVATQNPVRDVHHDQLLVRLDCAGRSGSKGTWKRRKERQRNCRPFGLEEVTSGQIHDRTFNFRKNGSALNSYPKRNEKEIIFGPKRSI